MGINHQSCQYKLGPTFSLDCGEEAIYLGAFLNGGSSRRRRVGRRDFKDLQGSLARKYVWGPGAEAAALRRCELSTAQVHTKKFQRIPAVIIPV